MYASQLEELINKDTQMRRIFGGIYSRDNVPLLSKISHDMAFIVNASDSGSAGTHWLLGYIKPSSKHFIWFDSFGKKPSFYGKKFASWLKPLKGYKIEINVKVVQASNSHYCGLFVLYVMYFLSRGVGMYRIMQKFSKHLLGNDRIVSRFAWNKFRFNAKKETHPDSYISEMNKDFFKI